MPYVNILVYCFLLHTLRFFLMITSEKLNNCKNLRWTFCNHRLEVCFLIIRSRSITKCSIFFFKFYLSSYYFYVYSRKIIVLISIESAIWVTTLRFVCVLLEISSLCIFEVTNQLISKIDSKKCFYQFFIHVVKMCLINYKRVIQCVHCVKTLRRHNNL